MRRFLVTHDEIWVAIYYRHKTETTDIEVMNIGDSLFLHQQCRSVNITLRFCNDDFTYS